MIKEGSAYKLDLYQCPSDRGYPEDNQFDMIDDTPDAQGNRPCYDTIGNSYRGSLATLGAGASWMLSRSVWGHKFSSLRDTSQLVLLGEPMFFNMIRKDDGSSGGNQGFFDPVFITGWHGQAYVDNILFVDGSARPTRAAPSGPIAADVVDQLNVVDANWTLRGTSFKIDSAPTPGAIFRGNPNAGANAGKWPYAGARKLLPTSN